MRNLARSLLVLMLGFSFLSASAAATLGLQTSRMLAFTSLLMALAVMVAVAQPRLPVCHDPVPLALLAALGVLALQDMGGTFDPLEYKLALPIVGLLVAPRIAALLGKASVARTVWLVLSAYIALTAVGSLGAGADALARGHDEVERWDATGSVITHGNLCAIYVLVAAAAVRDGGSGLPQLLAAGLGLAALTMAFLSGTRTVLVIWAVFLGLSAFAIPADRKRMVLLVSGLALALTLHTLLFSDSLAQRLLGGSDDYSSGRWDSVLIWLGQLIHHPLGIGIGGVRSLLAGGRPEIDGERLLEWPHDEFIRLFVEGGPVGLAFALTLVAYLVRRALKGAATTSEPLQRVLLLALAADVVAEMALQNFLNGVYQATVVILLVGVLGTPALPEPLTRAAATG